MRMVGLITIVSIYVAGIESFRWYYRMSRKGEGVAIICPPLKHGKLCILVGVVLVCHLWLRLIWCHFRTKDCIQRPSYPFSSCSFCCPWPEENGMRTGRGGGFKSCGCEWSQARCFLSHLWARITSVAEEWELKKPNPDDVTLPELGVGWMRARGQKRKVAGSRLAEGFKENGNGWCLGSHVRQTEGQVGDLLLDMFRRDEQVLSLARAEASSHQPSHEPRSNCARGRVFAIGPRWR